MFLDDGPPRAKFAGGPVTVDPPNFDRTILCGLREHLSDQTGRGVVAVNQECEREGTSVSDQLQSPGGRLNCHSMGESQPPDELCISRVGHLWFSGRGESGPSKPLALCAGHSHRMKEKGAPGCPGAEGVDSTVQAVEESGNRVRSASPRAKKCERPTPISKSFFTGVEPTFARIPPRALFTLFELLGRTGVAAPTSIGPADRGVAQKRQTFLNGGTMVGSSR